jgi:hypothetical protein
MCVNYSSINKDIKIIKLDIMIQIRTLIFTLCLVQENVKGKNVKGEKEDGMNDFPLFGTL